MGVYTVIDCSRCKGTGERPSAPVTFGVCELCEGHGSLLCTPNRACRHSTFMRKADAAAKDFYGQFYNTMTGKS